MKKFCLAVAVLSCTLAIGCGGRDGNTVTEVDPDSAMMQKLDAQNAAAAQEYEQAQEN